MRIWGAVRRAWATFGLLERYAVAATIAWLVWIAYATVWLGQS